MHDHDEQQQSKLANAQPFSFSSKIHQDAIGENQKKTYPYAPEQ